MERRDNGRADIDPGPFGSSGTASNNRAGSPDCNKLRYADDIVQICTRRAGDRGPRNTQIRAAENRTTIAEIFTQYKLSLKNRIEGEKVHDILANPYFRKSMDEAQEKLQSGKAVWHTYDDIFGS